MAKIFTFATTNSQASPTAAPEQTSANATEQTASPTSTPEKTPVTAMKDASANTPKQASVMPTPTQASANAPEQTAMATGPEQAPTSTSLPAPDPSATGHGTPTVSCTPAEAPSSADASPSGEALQLANGERAPLTAIPVFSFSAFSIWTVARIREGFRVVSFFAVPLSAVTEKEEAPSSAEADPKQDASQSNQSDRNQTSQSNQSNQGSQGSQGNPAGQANQGNGTFRLFCVLASDESGKLSVISSDVTESYPSLTTRIPQLHLFERAVYEKHGLVPEGHPWLKPVRFLPKNDSPEEVAQDDASQPDEGQERPSLDRTSLESTETEQGGIQSTPSHVGKADFFEVTGDEVHEVAVGPIHAGVIECGHFRFQCLGEEVLHLEISLGYHHRGVESLILGGPDSRTLPLMEAVSGDTTIAHTWAYCSIIESMSGCIPSPRGQILRALALELERLANHTGDMGALAGDVGFLSTSSFCGRLRGDWLNMTALLCGSRFGRGLLVPGGTSFDLPPDVAATLRERIVATARDVQGAIKLGWDAPSVMARLTAIGPVTQEQAVDIGLVGPVARSCGLKRDARHNHPQPGVPAPPPMTVTSSGDDDDVSDVRSRAALRHGEITESVAYCLHLIDDFLNPSSEPDESDAIDAAERSAGTRLQCGTQGVPATEASCTYGLEPLSFCASLVEAWRGELCHVAITGSGGRFAAYEITDPSFHNWMGLALALRNQQISDFPLCNKSFNLSYCGHDL